jgi:hypothetical protein
VVSELRSAVASLHGRYGDVPEVRRLKNDLERLELDVHDVGALSRSGPQAAPAAALSPLTDEPYDPAMWAEDADDEGLGGYHGAIRR